MFILFICGKKYNKSIDYPGFRNATIIQIQAMNHTSPDQLHWPELDEDIDLNALEYPEAFPLAYQK